MLPNNVIDWPRFRADCRSFAATLPQTYEAIYGVPTGGCFVARELCDLLDASLLDIPQKGCLIVDDLCDSGKTLQHPKYRGFDTAALYYKPHTPEGAASHFGFLREGWLVFPWEANHPAQREEGPRDAIVRLLEFVGEDPTRNGLLATPDRVLRAWKEMTEGYQQDPKAILGTVFEEPYDEVVLVRNIPFVSTCEHHLLVFSGFADVGYIPGKVVGLSKLARLVDCFAKRLQIQEKLTRQIAQAVEQHLEPQGVAVVLRAEHSCMACRGIRKPGTQMVTSCMLGSFRTQPEARAEFLSLCQR